jgi:hypothetical protein
LSANNHFPGKGNLSSEREYSPAHLFDCFIVHVIVELPTDHEMGSSILQVQDKTCPKWGMRQKMCGQMTVSILSLPLVVMMGESKCHKQF